MKNLFFFYLILILCSLSFVSCDANSTIAFEFDRRISIPGGLNTFCFHCSVFDSSTNIAVFLTVYDDWYLFIVDLSTRSYTLNSPLPLPQPVVSYFPQYASDSGCGFFLGPSQTVYIVMSDYIDSYIDIVNYLTGNLIDSSRDTPMSIFSSVRFIPELSLIFTISPGETGTSMISIFDGTPGNLMLPIHQNVLFPTGDGSFNPSSFGYYNTTNRNTPTLDHYVFSTPTSLASWSLRIYTLNPLDPFMTVEAESLLFTVSTRDIGFLFQECKLSTPPQVFGNYIVATVWDYLSNSAAVVVWKIYGSDITSVGTVIGPIWPESSSFGISVMEYNPLSQEIIVMQSYQHSIAIISLDRLEVLSFYYSFDTKDQDTYTGVYVPSNNLLLSGTCIYTQTITDSIIFLERTSTTTQKVVFVIGSLIVGAAVTVSAVALVTSGATSATATTTASSGVNASGSSTGKPAPGGLIMSLFGFMQFSALIGQMDTAFPPTVSGFFGVFSWTIGGIKSPISDSFATPSFNYLSNSTNLLEKSSKGYGIRELFSYFINSQNGARDIDQYSDSVGVMGGNLFISFVFYFSIIGMIFWFLYTYMEKILPKIRPSSTKEDIYNTKYKVFSLFITTCLLLYYGACMATLYHVSLIGGTRISPLYALSYALAWGFLFTFVLGFPIIALRYLILFKDKLYIKNNDKKKINNYLELNTDSEEYKYMQPLVSDYSQRGYFWEVVNLGTKLGSAIIISLITGFPGAFAVQSILMLILQGSYTIALIRIKPLSSGLHQILETFLNSIEFSELITVSFLTRATTISNVSSINFWSTVIIILQISGIVASSILLISDKRTTVKSAFIAMKSTFQKYRKERVKARHDKLNKRVKEISTQDNSKHINRASQANMQPVIIDE